MTGKFYLKKKTIKTGLKDLTMQTNLRVRWRRGSLDLRAGGKGWKRYIREIINGENQERMGSQKERQWIANG